MSALRRIIYGLVSVLGLQVAVAQAGESPPSAFDPEAHFPSSPLLYVRCQSVAELGEHLKTTLLGRMASHPGMRAAFAGLEAKVLEALEDEWAPFVEATGKSPPELLRLLSGEVAFTVKGVSPTGLPELALAVELGESRGEIVRVLERLRRSYEEASGMELPTRLFGGVDAVLWPTPAGSFAQAVVGDHLIEAFPAELLGELVAAASGRSDAPDRGDARARVGAPDLVVHADAGKLLGLALALQGGPPGAGDVAAALRVAGADGLGTVTFALGPKGGAMESALHVGLRPGTGGVLGVLRDAFAPIGDLSDALSRVPQSAHEIQAARLRPGVTLRSIDALVRGAFPEVAGELYQAYAQLEAVTGVSFEKDLATLPDITLVSFSIEPPAGGLISDQVLVAKTEALRPYWRVLEKLALSTVGAQFRPIGGADSKVECLSLYGSRVSGELPSLLEAFDSGWTPSGVETVLLATAGLGLSVTRTELDGGWTAVSTLPQAVGRYRSHYSREVSPVGTQAADIRSLLEGASAGFVSRGGRSLLGGYNTLVSLAGSFSPLLALAGVDAASFPPAEEFLPYLGRGYLRFEAGPEGFTWRGERVLETSGGVLVAVGGAAVLAAVLVPTVSRERAVSRDRGEASMVRCANNLRQLFPPAMAYSDLKGTRAFPHSPDGSLASLQVLVDFDPEGVLPEIFVCPESVEIAAEELEGGRFVLTDDTCSYEIVPWRLKNTVIAILLYDKTPCHRGGRNVLFTDARVQFMPEPEFQEALARDRARFAK